ncbi:hypothetical protein GCM10027610_001810 [Dactylosporangium cerinum]
MRLGSPSNPAGLSGYLYNVSTDGAYRRRGYSLACVTAMLDWFRHRGVARVQLHATDNGYELYRRLGFRDVDHASMVIAL